MQTELMHYINEKIQFPGSALTYGDGAGGQRFLRQAFARSLNRHFKPMKRIDAEHICITNGVSSAVEHLSNLLADPGDVFLLGQPYFGGFLNSIGLRTGTQVVPVSFGDVDPLSKAAVEVYETAIKTSIARSQKVAGLVLCNPHNPLGRCYPKETLKGLMQLCGKYNVHFISDEIYAMSVFNPNELKSEVPSHGSCEGFTSLCAIEPSDLIDPSLVHIVYGLSKDFGANGLRIGCIISQNNAKLHQALVPPIVYSYASSISELIAAKVLGNDQFTDWYIAENRLRLKQRYTEVVRWADYHQVEYRKDVQAAFFLWVNFGAVFRRTKMGEAMLQANESDSMDLDNLIQQALLAGKVFLISGSNCGHDSPGWFRIVFSQARRDLDEGLRRTETALGLPRDPHLA